MLTTRQNIDPFGLFRTEMDRLLEHYLGGNNPEGGFGRMPRQSAFPALNVWENEESFFVEAECPGLKIQEVDVSITGRQLSLNGSRSDERSDVSTYHRRERGTGRFHRTVVLPGDVNTTKVEATLTNGVLTVRIPKAETAKPRKVEVKN